MEVDETRVEVDETRVEVDETILGTKKTPNTPSEWIELGYRNPAKMH